MQKQSLSQGEREREREREREVGSPMEKGRERRREPWAAPVGTRVVPNPCAVHLGVQPLSRGTALALDPGIKGQGGGRGLKKQRLVFREDFNQKSATGLFPNDGESCGIADGSIHSES